MRSFIYVAPFVAAVFAQTTSESSPSSSSSTTIPYSNPNTAYLTETNSYGVVTGQPSNTAVAVTEQPAAVTTQPAAAQIPADLPSGLYTIHVGNVSSFTIDVAQSMTSIIGGAVVDAAATTASAGSSASGVSSSGASSSSASTTGTMSTSSGASSTSASASKTSTGAAATIKVATGSFLGLGALFLGLL